MALLLDFAVMAIYISNMHDGGRDAEGVWKLGAS